MIKEIIEDASSIQSNFNKVRKTARRAEDGIGKEFQKRKDILVQLNTSISSIIDAGIKKRQGDRSCPARFIGERGVIPSAYLYAGFDIVCNDTVKKVVIIPSEGKNVTKLKITSGLVDNNNSEIRVYGQSLGMNSGNGLSDDIFLANKYIKFETCIAVSFPRMRDIKPIIYLIGDEGALRFSNIGREYDTRGKGSYLFLADPKIGNGWDEFPLDEIREFINLAGDSQSTTEIGLGNK